MADVQHTPGPWLCTSTGPIMQGYQQPFAVAQWPEPNLICGCFGDVRGGHPVAQANARLIAAAPDLLVALKRLRDAWGSLSEDEPLPDSLDNDDDWLMADEAIAKAEGRT